MGHDDDHVRITLRPIGTPVALGLGAVMIGTTMLSGLQLEWLDTLPEQQTVAFVALAAAFPLQLLASILAFLSRDSLAGTGLAIFGSMWSVSGLTLLNGAPGQTNHALGMFFLLGATGLLLLLLSAGKGRVVILAMLVTGSVRLLLSGLYELTASSGVQTAAGIAGLVLAAVCAYGVVAILQEDLPKPGLLPIGRSGAARSSLEGSLREQIGRVENEAGVRRQL